ncbi:hypothetical protein JRF84_30990 [Methylobacterium organophilum]|jgi:hypothetical protein|uniref:hypothetical protein n=1 Tax=Methylobacterium organophilum TaxID=410 RepID=UPI0019D106EC|nr:hypothetical protein [Methylobacterium organophilum]MBN6823992.1 hypothetical protein [Methylobacterium organophilum]
MTEDEAKAEAIRRWNALPEDERQTRDQAAEFALKITPHLVYAGNGNPYQEIKRWLFAEMRGR